jgi:PAS domain S-box-containing protein
VVPFDRRQSEQALRASEACYRSLIENLEQCIFLKDTEFRFVTVNPPFCQAVGREAEEIVGHTDFDFYPPELARKFREDDRQVLQGRRLETEEESMIGGQRRIVRVVKTPVREEQGRIVGVLGIFWDITEQRCLEAQLRQAQKMEAIGQLAGGVAHDFNNLLTAILGNLSLLADHVGPDPAAQDMLRAGEAAALRAANLTSQLLGFARRALLRPEATNLNILIDEVVGLLRHTIDPRIIIEVRHDPNLWPVLADAGHVSQVLMNLCLNSRDAMPAGGHLLIETANAVLRPEKVRHQLEAHSGDVVCLRVSDTGLGMTEEVRAHLFEPFFTTKGQGKGTGLGLATVFGIVKQHHGWIECTSQPREGTVFSIYLPRFHLPRPQNAESDPMRPESGQLKGTETILFVDDEPILRNLGRTILQQHGYRVLVAEDGIEAIELFQREQGKIDLVILDLTMPRLSGRDTLRELRLLDTEVRVLFASGFSHEQLSIEEQEQTVGFVAKPYRPRELVSLVRQTLDQSASVR